MKQQIQQELTIANAQQLINKINENVNTISLVPVEIRHLCLGLQDYSSPTIEKTILTLSVLPNASDPLHR